MMEPLDRLNEALKDRYRLERELGSGGMATVWLARDLKHDRDVALKVLRPELAASLGPERFLAEIRTTAKLQHPHIVALFDSGEADGFLYYVMPCIEGESLRSRLDREKRLDVEAMLAIARPVAQALAYAHELGIVHRDIKPENILLSRGQPFVTDFGIARAVSAAGAERLTRTGIGIGTPAYMSPEQAFGEPTVDARSDIYSLGCVIYEMLSGSPPFTGSTVEALLARRVMGPPPHLTDVPGPVDEVVRKSLATQPQDRFTTAIALADALVEAAHRPATPEKSLVVLPFENLSPDPDNAFFADGLTEELIADLSKVEALRVISRTSAMQFRETTKGVPAIARELNVRYVLEGSVRKAGNSLRITAQLIDSKTDVHLWAEKYTGTMDDVFDLQERLSRQIVEALRVKLTPQEDKRLAERPIQDVRAYEAWLRASVEAWKFSAAGVERAIGIVSHALETVGENALLRATLGYSYAVAYDVGLAHGEDTLQRAEQYAKQALDLDPTVPQAHLALAWVRYKQGGVAAGIPLFERAAGLGSRDALWILAFGLGEVGRIADARRWADAGMAADPLNEMTGFARGMVEFWDGRFEDAVGWLQRCIEKVAPDSQLLLWGRAQAMAYAGRRGEAASDFKKVAGQEAGVISSLSELYCVALSGDRAAVQRALTADTELFRAALTDEWYPNFIAACLAMVGDHDGAIDWLERAVAWGFSNHRFLGEYSPFLAPLRGHPRFERLLELARENERAFGR
jgi:eukaryotic-like serine/threonine-protein kinase